MLGHLSYNHFASKGGSFICKSPQKSICELAGSLKSHEGKLSQYIVFQGSSGTANIHSCSSVA